MECVCGKRAAFDVWFWCDSDDGGEPRGIVCPEHLKDIVTWMSREGAMHTEYLHYWHIAVMPMNE